VGDVVGVNEHLLRTLFTGGFVPVLACLGADDAGAIYNINADIVANQTAKALKAQHLVLCTSTPGVLRDIRDLSSRIPLLTPEEARGAISEGVIKDGMIPKIEESLRVLGEGVGSIHIVGALGPGDLVRAITEPGTIGTTLRGSPSPER